MRKSETLRDMLSRRAAKNITEVTGNDIEIISDSVATQNDVSVGSRRVGDGSNNHIVGSMDSYYMGTSSTLSAHSDSIVLGRDNNYTSQLDYNIPSLKVQQTELNSDFNSDVKKASSNVEAYIIIPDIHSYARDPKAYELAMQSVTKLKDHYNITKVVQLGDIIECGQYSSHPTSSAKDIVQQKYLEEIDWALDDFWARIQRDCPNADYHQLMGNHEDRVDKYFAKRLGSGDDVAAIVHGMESDGRFEDRGIQVTPYGEEDTRDSLLLLDNDIICVHGWSFAANAAKTHLAKLQGRSVLFGHTHRSQSQVERDAVTNKLRGAWSFGSLAKNQMTYQKGSPNDHTSGFGMVLRIGEHFRVDTIPITESSTGKRAVILPVDGGLALQI